jgi:hypothetical protein
MNSASHEQDITNICTLASGLLASGHYTETTAAGDPLPKLHHSGDRAATHSAIRLYEDIREKWQAHLNQKLGAAPIDWFHPAFHRWPTWRRGSKNYPATKARSFWSASRVSKPDPIVASPGGGSRLTRRNFLRRALLTAKAKRQKAAMIAEMAFLGQVGMIFLETIIIRGFDFTSFATCLHAVLVAVGTLFPDPADRFLDVCDADWGCDLGLGSALSSAVELETRL